MLLTFYLYGTDDFDLLSFWDLVFYTPFHRMSFLTRHLASFFSYVLLHLDRNLSKSSLFVDRFLCRRFTSCTIRYLGAKNKSRRLCHYMDLTQNELSTKVLRLLNSDILISIPISIRSSWERRRRTFL